MESQALNIIKRLKEHNYEAVYAGGWVRDHLLGIEASDIDIATSAKPEQIEALFDKCLAIGKAFGVIIVVVDDIEIEVATFRKDSQESDGRHPDSVIFSSMEEDAKRRDFTINGMFYDPITAKIIDYVGGQKDLKKGLIRFIGNPEERIIEDKLRLMRAIRFASRFNFEIEDHSWKAIKKYSQDILQISEERVADELLKILRTRNYSRVMDLLFESKLINAILPEIVALKGVEQPIDYHPEGDVYIHTVLALSLLPENASDELILATLFHDIGKPVTQTFEDRIRFNNHDMKGKDITRNILKRLKFSNDFIDRVCCLVENHMRTACVKKMRVSKLKRFMTLPNFEEHLELHRVDCLASHRNLENVDFLTEKLKTFNMDEIRSVVGLKPNRILTGDDLIELGFKQGPIFREILTDVEDKQLEGILVEKEQAVSYVLSFYGSAVEIGGSTQVCKTCPSG